MGASYASQDSVAAAEITRVLRAAGIEVWFDQSELRGGDAWDASIRRQIKACSLFIPVISKNTHAREEGYFRLEWKLAVDRSHLMATTRAFLLPVVIDDTRDDDDRVPDRFRDVQWTRLPGGGATAAFVERVAKLLAPEGASIRGAPDGERSGSASAPGAGSTNASARGKAAPRSRATLLRGLLLLAAVAAIAIGYIGERRESKRDAAVPSPVKMADTPALPAAAAGAIPEKSIAVLPFVDMSEKKDQEYFSDGLAEELLDLLAQVRDLRVAARTSSFSFRGKSDDIATIAQKLRVAHVLEGSVRRSGDVIRVSAQLIRADNGYDLWSKTYDRQVKDIFKVQDEIAGAVVDALKLQLLPAQQIESRHRTANTEAYTQYLIGNQLRELDTSESTPKALIAYQKAVALDPGYGDAYAGLAATEWRIADMMSHDAAAYARAKSSADKAIALAPNSAEGYWARGVMSNFYYWDWQAAQLDYEKARALDPSFTPVSVSEAGLLATLGRQADAVATLRQAVALDPLSIFAWRKLGQLLVNVGEIEEGRAAARRLQEIHPNTDDQGVEAIAQLLAGRPAEALAASTAQSFSRGSLGGVAMAEYTLGNREESDRALAEYIKERGEPFAYQFAEVYAWRGENDKAFEWLETAYRTHDGGLPYITYDPLIAKLRSDPRFGAFLRKMKLAPN